MLVGAAANIKIVDFGFSRQYLEGKTMTDLVGPPFCLLPEVEMKPNLLLCDLNKRATCATWIRAWYVYGTVPKSHTCAYRVNHTR